MRRQMRNRRVQAETLLALLAFLLIAGMENPTRKNEQTTQLRAGVIQELATPKMESAIKAAEKAKEEALEKAKEKAKKKAFEKAKKMKKEAIARKRAKAEAKAIAKAEAEAKAKAAEEKRRKEEEAAEAQRQYEINLLAHLMNGEAGNMDSETQLLVGSVVLNRVKYEDVYPDTIHDVIFDEGQYACTWDGNFNKEPDEETYKLAEWLIDNGSILPANVVFQAQFVQGKGTYTKRGNQYFCYL